MSDARIGNNPNTGLRVQIDSSRTRQTQKTDFGTVLGEGLSRGADAIISAGQLAAPAIPGGQILSAALTSVGSLKSSASGQSSGQGTVSMGGNASTLVGGTTSSSGASTTSSIDGLANSGDKQAMLLKAQENMQEMSMSFNMQYLGLQQKMQDENRRFSVLSNIMKTKHDTAKNSISNIR